MVCHQCGNELLPGEDILCAACAVRSSAGEEQERPYAPGGRLAPPEPEPAAEVPPEPEVVAEPEPEPTPVAAKPKPKPRTRARATKK